MFCFAPLALSGGSDRSRGESDAAYVHCGAVFGAVGPDRLGEQRTGLAVPHQRDARPRRRSAGAVLRTGKRFDARRRTIVRCRAMPLKTGRAMPECGSCPSAPREVVRCRRRGWRGERSLRPLRRRYGLPPRHGSRFLCRAWCPARGRGHGRHPLRAPRTSGRARREAGGPR
jgi:hypothetical protein